MKPWFHMLMVAGYLTGSLAWAASQPGTASPREASAHLDAAIEQVLQEPEFTWRMPRDAVEVDPTTQGTFLSFFDEIATWFNAAIDGLSRLLQYITDWMLQWDTSSPDIPRPEGTWGTSTQVLLFLLLAIVATMLGLFIWRYRRLRLQRAVATPVAPAPIPEVTEHTQADERPEDEWRALSRTYGDRGEYRLAVRALFLSCLASLGRSGLIHIARHKSNREYLCELERHQAALPELPDLTHRIVSHVERVWYGPTRADAPYLSTVESWLEHLVGMLGPAATPNSDRTPPPA